MTENEYKKLLEKIFSTEPFDSKEVDNIQNIFKEIQQYRAIGTVEQLEWCKDASHWKELFKEKLEKYEAIGTIEEFKALKESELKCKDCAGCTNWLCDCANERARAIDEFVKEIEAEYNNDGCPNVSDYLDYKISIRDLQKIAEHLKGGATDERTGSN